MGEGGINFVDESKKLLTEMLNVDHVSGHNVLFDLNMMRTTLNELDAFHADDSAKNLLRQVFEKVNTDQNYLIDTAETTRKYFTDLAEQLHPGQSDAIVRQLLSPQSYAQINLGGSIAPVSVENIALNTNLFQLIEQNDQGLAEQITAQLQKGSHVADTDVALQASIDRYQRSGELKFRHELIIDATTGDITGTRPIGALSEFEQYAMGKVLRSSALLPITNMADVQQASRAAVSFLGTEQGMQGVQVRASARDLGLSSGIDDGILYYNKAQDSFMLKSISGSAAEDVVAQAAASDYINRTLRQAERDSTPSALRVGTSTVAISRNVANDKIISLGFTAAQSTGMEEASIARSITQTLAPASLEGNEDMFIRSLGLTTEQFGGAQERRTLKDVFSSLRGQKVSSIKNPIAFSRETIDSYYTNAAQAGLPFHNINVADRAVSVGVAQATASIAKNAPSAAYAQNADLLSEMGLSFFRTQEVSRIGNLSSIPDSVGAFDTNPSSKVMLPFNEFFSTDSVTTGNQAATTTLRVKAFEGTGMANTDIMGSDLNRFTLSYVTGSGESEKLKIASRVNVVWGANNTLSQDQSQVIAKHMFENIQSYENVIAEAAKTDEVLQRELGSLKNLRSTFGSASNQDDIIKSFASHIRERGITVGYAEGEAAEGIRLSYLSRNIDLAGNDIRALDLGMRLAHADTESGVLIMSALSDTKVDEAVGRTAQVAQDETNQALKRFVEANELLNDPARRRAAKRTIRDAGTSGGVDRAVNLTRDVVREISTPLADFYRANKKPIGLGGLALAGASIGYYMYKKKNEQDTYQEAMAYMPTEASTGTPNRQMDLGTMPKSTRRDPLVTAGVVGNLDRNKIGHTSMGPNKYNHLYGG